MHWVDRGPEPSRLPRVRSRYTPAWIEHYRHGTGKRPNDDKWRDFHDDLSRVFSDLCAYCEEVCRGEVDHFRPKSKFPEQVYEWSNWLFACHDCNLWKSEEWPKGGYIDPCAKSAAARPERFFDFDTDAGIIKPRAGLSPKRRQKALSMIKDLRLNAHHHVKKRLIWRRILSEVLASDAGLAPLLSDRKEPLSSLTRAILGEWGYRVFTP